MESKITIARTGSKLGTFTSEQVRDGLKSGLFRPSDHYWQPGSKAWATLATLYPGLGSNPRPAAAPVPNAAPKSGSFGGCLSKALGAMTIAAVLAIGAAVYLDQDFKSEEDYQGLKSEEDRAEAQYYFQQAAGICKSLASDRGAMLAVLLTHGAFSEGDEEIVALRNALPHLRMAAEKGDSTAQYFVGSVLLKLEHGNKTEAEAFLIRAANQGHPLASRMLSQEYLLRHPLHTSNRQKVEEGIAWHLITPENLRNRHLTAALADSNDPAMQAARRRAAEFRPLSEYRTERMRQNSEWSGKK